MTVKYSTINNCTICGQVRAPDSLIVDLHAGKTYTVCDCGPVHLECLASSVVCKVCNKEQHLSVIRPNYVLVAMAILAVAKSISLFVAIGCMYPAGIMSDDYLSTPILLMGSFKSIIEFVAILFYCALVIVLAETRYDRQRDSTIINYALSYVFADLLLSITAQLLGMPSMYFVSGRFLFNLASYAYGIVAIFAILSLCLLLFTITHVIRRAARIRLYDKYETIASG